MTNHRLSVLFVCTHNSSRSQMAEGLLRTLASDKYTVFSAGTEPRGVNSFAERVMREIGVDISDQESKHVDRYHHDPMDIVVTVCDDARDNCPYVPARVLNLHKSFADPSAAVGSDDDKLNVFRDVRDQIRRWLEEEFENAVLVSSNPD